MEVEYLKSVEYNVKRCSGFGICKGGYKQEVSPCPLNMTSAGFEAETPRGIITMAQDLLQGDLEYSRDIADILFKCTFCGNCGALCGSIDPESGETLVDPGMIALAMKVDLVNAGLVPATVRDFLKNLYLYGNPYASTAEERAKWADGLNIEYQNEEFLLFAGCESSYDERGKKMAKAIVSCLKKAGVNFGILGSDEINDGNEAKYVGEQGLFRYLAARNIETFKRLGVKKIITISPHSYNIIKNDYPTMGGVFKVFHYSEILLNFLDSGILKLNEKKNFKAAYHDPCFLGRHNSIYDQPRQIIRSIPGCSLVEMQRNRENALCCGGGGGNFFTDVIKGSAAGSPSRTRVQEAIRSGAQSLIVACPSCAKMLDDAVVAEGLENQLEVQDLAELVVKVLT